MTVKCNMTGRVTRNLDDLELQFQCRQAEPLSIAETSALAWNSRVVRPQYFRAAGFGQPGHAANVIGMVVRDEDAVQLQPVLIERFEYCLGVSWVDNRTFSTTCRNEPDIIVCKCRYRNDCNFRHIRFRSCSPQALPCEVDGRFYQNSGCF